jgi:hypothetical protein
MVYTQNLKQLKKLNVKHQKYGVSMLHHLGLHHNLEQGEEEELNLVRTLVFRNEVRNFK